jgi:hypothetical protein
VDDATRDLIINTTNPAGGWSHTGTWDRMVHVGQGNTPGEEWWVVAVLWGYPPGSELHQEGTPLEINSYLTNQPGLPAGQVGESLEVGTPGQEDWRWIEWDADRLKHARERQRLAFACVRATAPQDD